MKYFAVFLLIAAASTTSFGQQFHIVKSKVEMVSVADPPLVIIDGKIMPRLIKSKSDSTQMVSPLDEINEMEIEHILVLKRLLRSFDLWRSWQIWSHENHFETG